MNKPIFVPVEEVRHTEKEKGSVFIAIVQPIESIDDVEKRLNGLKKEFFDASHHSYASLELNGRNKFSDDGEPKGSAGIRILNAIEHVQLTNVVVTVVRYFGGTKLGIGPLGMSYYNCAVGALMKVRKKECSYYDICQVEVSAADSSIFYHLLAQFSAKIDDTHFEKVFQHNVIIPRLHTHEFIKQLSERSAGRIKCIVQKSNILI